MMDQETLNRLWEPLGHAEQVFPSRRERIATAALSAVIATSALPGPAEERAFVAGAADFAVQFADALIARLDKP